MTKIKPKFAVDDKVSFADSLGRPHTGKVRQVSKKTYFVMVVSNEDGQYYSVHENRLVRL